jgi:hypothetical protein
VLLLAALLPLAAGAAAPDRLLGYSGQALALSSSQLLYVEQHLLRERGGELAERLVLYRCADGTAFARKRIDYSGAGLAPSFELFDARFDYREGLRRREDRLYAFAGIGAAAGESRLTSSADLVADAGFEQLVQQRWQSLQAGESQRIDFVVPSRGESLSFRLRKVETLEIEGQPASRIRLSLSGFFGLFAPDIDVIYRDADRWLLRFEGLTNIRASADSNLSARIEFPNTPAEQDGASWKAAELAPLAACPVGV